MVEQARSDGVDVMFDAFPYTCGNTTITVVLPHWFLKRGAEAYRNPWLKLRLRLELEAGFRLVGFMYNDFQVMDAAIPGSDDLNGLRVTEIARKWGMSPFNTLLRLCEKSGGGTLVLFHAYSGEPGREDVIERVLSHELCLFETDAVIKDKGYPNPSAMGAFPRILGPLARDRKLFTLEQAIRRSTLESAQRFNIRDRGEIAPGKAADIVVFDPAVISDTPPAGITPSGRPAGIRNVFINGISVVSQGLMTANHRAGMVIRT
jgi:N-acyl-D-amino-acid deacylase